MRKRILILGLISMMLFAVSGCGEKEDDWEKRSAEQKLDTYFALIKESMLLKEDLGENTPYIAMLRSVKGDTISYGAAKEDALKKAESLIISEQAVFWYADKNNISATDKEVAEYIKTNVIEQVRTAEDFDKMEKACNENSLTFEDTIWAYEDSYKWEYILRQLSETYDEELLNQIISEFKASEEYEEVLRIVKNCSALIEKGENDIDVLRKSAIFYQ